MVADIIRQAAQGLPNGNQTTYEAAFNRLLPQLGSVTKANLTQAFAQAIKEQIEDHTTGDYRSPDVTAYLLELAHAAGLDQAIVDGFSLVSCIEHMHTASGCSWKHKTAETSYLIVHQSIITRLPLACHM